MKYVLILGMICMMAQVLKVSDEQNVYALQDSGASVDDRLTKLGLLYAEQVGPGYSNFAPGGFDNDNHQQLINQIRQSSNKDFDTFVEPDSEKCCCGSCWALVMKWLGR